MHSGTVNLCGQIVLNTIIDEIITNEFQADSILQFKDYQLKDI